MSAMKPNFTDSRSQTTLLLLRKSRSIFRRRFSSCSQRSSSLSAESNGYSFTVPARLAPPKFPNAPHSHPNRAQLQQSHDLNPRPAAQPHRCAAACISHTSFVLGPRPIPFRNSHNVTRPPVYGIGRGPGPLRGLGPHIVFCPSVPVTPSMPTHSRPLLLTTLGWARVAMPNAARGSCTAGRAGRVSATGRRAAS